MVDDDDDPADDRDRTATTCKRAAKALVRAANKGGGEDNITVVFFEIGEDVGRAARARRRSTRRSTADGDGELDEDTLDEFDRVPALDTMVVPPGEAEQRRSAERRAQPRPPDSRAAA